MDGRRQRTFWQSVEMAGESLAAFHLPSSQYAEPYIFYTGVLSFIHCGPSCAVYRVLEYTLQPPHSTICF